MITGVTVLASAQRLALWKRVAAMAPLALAATALAVQPAQAATGGRNSPGLRLMWVTETAVQIGWPASSGTGSYTYELYQMNGVRARSGRLPGFDQTTTFRDLHPGWKYQARVRANPDGAGAGWYATVSVTLPYLNAPHPDPPRELAYQWAQTQAGQPYLYGGQGDGGYDCSGLVRSAYRHAGIWLPRTTGEMLQDRRLDQEPSPRQGDLVFFGTGHVELYAGPDRSFGAETNHTGTWWNRWWQGSWWPTAFYRVSGAG